MNQQRQLPSAMKDLQDTFQNSIKAEPMEYNSSPAISPGGSSSGKLILALNIGLIIFTVPNVL